MTATCQYLLTRTDYNFKGFEVKQTNVHMVVFDEYALSAIDITCLVNEMLMWMAWSPQAARCSVKLLRRLVEMSERDGLPREWIHR